LGRFFNIESDYIFIILDAEYLKSKFLKRYGGENLECRWLRERLDIALVEYYRKPQRKRKLKSAMIDLYKSNGILVRKFGFAQSQIEEELIKEYIIK